MTLDQAQTLVTKVNPKLHITTNPDWPHVISIKSPTGTKNYDVRTLDEEILRSLVSPLAA